MSFLHGRKIYQCKKKTARAEKWGETRTLMNINKRIPRQFDITAKQVKICWRPTLLEYLHNYLRGFHVGNECSGSKTCGFLLERRVLPLGLRSRTNLVRALTLRCKQKCSGNEKWNIAEAKLWRTSMTRLPRNSCCPQNVIHASIYRHHPPEKKHLVC